MDYRTITLEEVQEWLERNGDTAMPLETILWQLAIGETDIDELRKWIMNERINLN